MRPRARTALRLYLRNRIMNEIKNLLFDFGGVLVDLDLERCKRAFASLGVDVERFLSHFGQSGVFGGLENGTSTFHECCDELRRQSGRAELTDEQVEWAWNEFLLDVPAERLELLLRLKKNYRLFLLSNTNAQHWSRAENDYFRYKGLNLSDFFEQMFLSYKLGTEKPSPEIFRAVEKGAGILPSETLFLDDSEENCEAARRCGFHALVAPAGGVWMNYFDKNDCLCKSFNP